MSETRLISYRWEELGTAPQSPGLYAWYYAPTLRKADLGDYDRTRENLRQIANRVRIPHLSMTAGGHLSMKFVGDLHHETIQERGDAAFSESVERILNERDTRVLFAEALSMAPPCLMAPLYIGVTDDIRRRLLEHKHDISQYLNLVNLPKQHSFAREVSARRLPPNSLVVYCCALDFLDQLETQDPQQIRTIAEAVETVLNRLFYPVFGRR